LELINDPSNLPQQEGPGVNEVDPVHHDGDDAVPALEAPGQAIFDEEGVAEHKTMLLVPKENGAFTARAYLRGNHSNSRDNPLLASMTQTDASSQILFFSDFFFFFFGSAGN
jgi:hypothetical protein